MPSGDWWLVVATHTDPISGDESLYYFGPMRHKDKAEAERDECIRMIKEFAPYSFESLLAEWHFSTRRLRDIKSELLKTMGLVL